MSCGAAYVSRGCVSDEDLSAQAFNKTDVADHGFALDWMQDFDRFQAALDQDSTYASTLSRSLSMVLDEFYANLKTVGVSAITGAGMGALFKASASHLMFTITVIAPESVRCGVTVPAWCPRVSGRM